MNDSVDVAAMLYRTNVRMDDILRTLEKVRSELETAHESLKPVVDWGFDKLDTPEQVVYQLMSLAFSHGRTTTEGWDKLPLDAWATRALNKLEELGE